MEMKYKKSEGFACQQILSVRVSKQLALRLHMHKLVQFRKLQFCSVILGKTSLVSTEFSSRGLGIQYAAAFISS